MRWWVIALLVLGGMVLGAGLVWFAFLWIWTDGFKNTAGF